MNKEEKGGMGTVRFTQEKNIEQLEAMQARNLQIVKDYLDSLPLEKQEDVAKLKVLMDGFHSSNFPMVMFINLGENGAFHFSNLMNLEIKRLKDQINMEQKSFAYGFEMCVTQIMVERAAYMFRDISEEQFIDLFRKIIKRTRE